MSDKQNPKIFPIPNGPLCYYTDFTEKEVKGLKGPGGRTYCAPEGTSLCRCGESENKPFCDGTHKETGFDDQVIGDGPSDRLRDYEGARITIHDNRSLCSHSRECFERLPEVFDPLRRPWITPDAATVEEIIETVRRCPSGALSYTVDGVRHVDQEREPLVTVVCDGPYHLTGYVEVEGVARGEGYSAEHCSLCRCGQSHNKPFCDGSHLDCDFKDG